jgi:GntR family transcriptional regulator
MNIQIKTGSGFPIYAQIADRIRHLVATGAMKPGEQLPTIRQLAVDLRVDPNTVARAYMILDSEGVISGQQGRGTYIAEHPGEGRLAAFRAEQLRQMLAHTIMETLSLGYAPAEVREVFLTEMESWEIRSEDAGAKIGSPK